MKTMKKLRLAKETIRILGPELEGAAGGLTAARFCTLSFRCGDESINICDTAVTSIEIGCDSVPM